MTAKQEREALELTAYITSAVVYPNIASRPVLRKPLLAFADKLLKSVDGQVRNDLSIARTNLKELS
jgi:hypothetical protein